MRTKTALTHEFVEFLPDTLEEGKVYISIPYATATHRCCCGCGNEVVTPLSPTDWKLIFNGLTISLDPSIGNWSFPCRSHYWIRNNSVQWDHQWSKGEIAAGRVHDKIVKQSYFRDSKPQPEPIEENTQLPKKRKHLLALYHKLRWWK